MRWLLPLFVVLAACTSPWERHQSKLAEHETAADWKAATAEQRWLIDNAFYHAPAGEQTAAAEAERYLHLADLASRSRNARVAVEALRQALTVDPSQAPAIRSRLDHLPLTDAERDRVKKEFAWNIAALQPSDDALLQQEREESDCWSYRVRELRIRHQRTVQANNGRERQVTYDARPWVFDAGAQRWQPDGAWVEDAGTEVELVSGPERPRYRAVITAEHQFYAEGAVPPCHRAGWKGPFEADGTIFVAPQLPLISAAAPR